MAGLKSLFGGAGGEPKAHSQSGYTPYPPPGSSEVYSTRIERIGRSWTIYPPIGSYPGYSTAVEPDGDG